MVINIELRTLKSRTSVEVSIYFINSEDKTDTVHKGGIKWVKSVLDEVVSKSSDPSKLHYEAYDKRPRYDKSDFWTMTSDLSADEIKSIAVSRCSVVEDSHRMSPYYGISVPTVFKRKDGSDFKFMMPVTVEIAVDDEIITSEDIVKSEKKDL